ncbi:MAG: putative cytoplasmic protein [Chloroflexi bacterium]|nr:putative cytoplasmic protein [Chloroflexota bacterium]
MLAKDAYSEEKITYFIKPGPKNSEHTLRLAIERAKVRGINKIVLASTRGETTRLAAGLLVDSGIKMVVVPHQYGFGPNQRFPPELTAELQKQGHSVYFGTMLFHTENFYGVRIPSAMATLLRTFCQGIKVCVEILLMATDGGCLKSGEKAIAVSGTIRGADTAVVAIAAPSTRLHELHITEIICKPFETKSWPASSEPPKISDVIEDSD